MPVTLVICITAVRWGTAALLVREESREWVLSISPRIAASAEGSMLNTASRPRRPFR